ncbi:MAG: MlaD family protein [Myxococcales bacterium]|nr:MlaD family protein [Myxococcales bacterium]
MAHLDRFVYDHGWMQDSTKSARVGLMVVLGVVATYFAFTYVDERGEGGDGYRVYALFEDAQGLVAKSRVVIAGIPVGHVDRISLEGNRARVDIQMNAGIELHDDASVALRMQSLLGEKSLVIHPGTGLLDEAGEPVVPLLEEGDRIPNAPDDPGMGDMLSQTNAILENIRAVTEQLQRSFGTDQAGRRMEEALASLAEALAAINRTIRTNEEIVHDTLTNIQSATDDATPRLARILENVEASTARIASMLERSQPDLEGAAGEVDDTLASIHRASEQLETVLADVQEVTDRTARGEGTVGRLTSDELLIDEVEGAAEGINELVGGITRLRTIMELRSEYNVLANSFKTYFSLRLQPREDRYYLFQLVDDPRGSIEETVTTVQRSGFPAADYTESRITRTRALRFSLMFAKRIGPATFRFGILESTGGLALDLHFLRDRLELQSEVFAVGEQAFPRLRVRAAFEIVSRLWVLGGIDDSLNDSRDAFLGLMLRFDDQDLKSILPFVGGFGT